MSKTPVLSLIIPTLNAAGSLAKTLEHAGDLSGIEVVISDGGSLDQEALTKVVSRFGATLITAPKGRGSQLRAGADAATGDGLLFLHADTRLPTHWQQLVTAYLTSPAAECGAAAFQLRFEDDTKPAARVSAGANWRSRVLGLPYGDQGLALKRRVYDQVGGYADVPLMEDVDLVRRIGRSKISLLPEAITTSAVRYQRDGWVLRPLRNILLLSLYFVGVRPSFLARFYG